MSIKEENLIQYSGNLMPGQRLVKVGNTFIPVGVGGAFEPGSGGGGSNNMKFYECASVDTTAETWSGYELILQNGVYTVSETLTEGLSYSAVTPVVGNTYSEDALIKVAYFYTGLPIDGLIFYASLATDTSITESGHTLIKSGSPTFTEDEWGMSCVEIKSDSYLYFEQSILPMNAESRSFSFWARVKDFTSSNFLCFGYGAPGSYRKCSIFIPESNRLCIDFYNCSTLSPVIDVYKWHHFSISYDSSTSSARMYVDGTLCASLNDLVLQTADGYDGYAFIGKSPEPNYGDSSTGYLAACRIYNRVLTQDEITVLANEFTPTTA